MRNDDRLITAGLVLGKVLWRNSDDACRELNADDAA